MKKVNQTTRKDLGMAVQTVLRAGRRTAARTGQGINENGQDTGEGIKMQYRKFGNTYMVRIDLGEDIVEYLKKLCEDEHILLGRVEAIGAADHAVIGVYDPGKKEYYPEKTDEFMEIASLNGSITAMDGKPYIHLHATLADRNHVIHGGHVIEMRVGATCEMFVTVLDGAVGRQKDEGLGINLWTF